MVDEGEKGGAAMVSEQQLVKACWQEHYAIVRCCAQAQRQGNDDGGSRVWEEELTHHAIVLAGLRELLQCQYHRALHA